MIDLRSDTLTKPTPEMLEFMMSAKVGDDVYGEDPTVNELQYKVAELFGKEAALFVPSGTMGNQIALKLLTNPGDEVILDSNAHIYYYETAAPAILSQIQLRPIASATGMPDLNKIIDTIRQDIYYLPKTTVIELENTHNRHGGAVLDYNYILQVKKIADNHGLSFHLDGARIWNASIASNISLNKLAEPFDTLSVCLSKGLGAPVGSLIISTRDNIQKALKIRKIFGGGMRQAGILAAAGIYALNNNLDKMKNDHINAFKFANEINKIPELSCNIENVNSNIVIFNYSKNLLTNDLSKELKNNGLLMHEFGNRSVRAVFYLDLESNVVENSINIIKETVLKLLK